MPESTPLFLRISATEGLEHESWELKGTKKLALKLAEQGKVIDISAFGNNPDQQLPTNIKEQAYPAPYAHAVKEVVGDKILVSAVGNISEPKVAESLIQKDIDLVLVGRFFVRSPGLVE